MSSILCIALKDNTWHEFVYDNDREAEELMANINTILNSPLGSVGSISLEGETIAFKDIESLALKESPKPRQSLETLQFIRKKILDDINRYSLDETHCKELADYYESTGDDKHSKLLLNQAYHVACARQLLQMRLELIEADLFALQAEGMF